MPLSRFSRAAFTLAALSTISLSVHARQPAPAGQLPCALASKQSLEAADEQTIRGFVSAHAPALSDADPAKNSDARAALMAPLACDGVTFAFRTKYADALVPALTPVLSSKEDRQAVNALLLLGRIRTTASADAIASGLKSQSPAIRFAAGAAYREILNQLSKDSFGFPEGAVDRVLDGLASALRTEADANTADILIVALGDAPKGDAALRGRAMLRLTDAMTRRLLTLRKEPAIGEDWSRAILRSLDLARQAILAQGGTGAIDKEFARRAAVFSGQVFAFARDRLGAMTSADADLSKAVAAAEGLAVIAHQAVTNQRLNEKGLQRAFDSSIGQAGGGEFTRAADSWIGAEGLLVKPPYGVAAAELAPTK